MPCRIMPLASASSTMLPEERICSCRCSMTPLACASKAALRSRATIRSPRVVLGGRTRSPMSSPRRWQRAHERSTGTGRPASGTCPDEENCLRSDSTTAACAARTVLSTIVSSPPAAVVRARHGRRARALPSLSRPLRGSDRGRLVQGLKQASCRKRDTGGVRRRRKRRRSRISIAQGRDPPPRPPPSRRRRTAASGYGRPCPCRLRARRCRRAPRPRR